MSRGIRRTAALWGIFLGGAFGCRPTEEPPPAPGALGLSPPAADGAYHATAQELYDAFRGDAKGARKLLKDRAVVVRGRVSLDRSDIEPNPERAQKGGRAEPDLFLRVNHPNPYDLFAAANAVEGDFPESARPQLRRLAKTLRGSGGDDSVRVRGHFESFTLGTVWLRDCALESPTLPDGEEPNPPATGKKK